jgi:signal transduction histidine kinase
VAVARLVAWQGAAERTAAAAAHTARVDAEVRARLLAGLARVNQLDVVSAADAAVATMTDLGFEMALVGRVDEDAGTMQALSATGFQDVAFLGEVLDIGDGLAGEAIASRGLVQVPDYAAYEHRLPGPGRDELGSTVAVPVVVDGRVVACVHGSRREVGVIPRAQVEVIEVLAAQLGRVFEMADRYDRERAVAAELAELDRMKRQFITSVSHELRTPMTMLQGFGETLRRHLGSLDSDAQALLLERLMANAARLDGLITSLVDLSRLEGSNLEVQPEEVRLEGVVLDVVRNLDALGDGHRVLLDLQAPVVTADPALLTRVLRHLLSNALLHTPPGTTVTVGSRTVGGGVRVWVVDDGPGIPADRMERVAERFYRASPVADRRGGLGIGLSLVRAMLEAHGSRLELSTGLPEQTAEGAGGRGLVAAFTLRPPVASVPEGSPAEATGVRSPR